MGKAAMCIQLLQILNTGRVYKISELAEMLDTNPRNIIEYKKELEECGYYIDTIPGRYGGYKLDMTTVIPALKLTSSEKMLILESINYLNSKSDFIKKEEYNKTLGKISSAIELPNNSEPISVIDHYQLSMSETEIQKRYEFIEDMIKSKNTIEIEYHSIKNGIKKHILHPYKLFLYNNSWFFLAWNPDVGDVWTFKLNRVKNWRRTGEKFKVWKYFKPENYLYKNGLKSNGEFYKVVYLARGVRKHLSQERIYGKNQEIEIIDDDTIKVTLEMQNKELIKSYFLSCGPDVEILEPDWLIEEVICNIDKVKSMYKKYI